MRRTLLLLLVGLAATVGAQEDDAGELRETTLAVDPDRIDVDRGPRDALGWGTLQDLFVPVSDRAGVSVFSGNLVVSYTPLPSGDLPPDARATLTYNHLDSGGSPELAAGWSWDLGRAIVDGAWGDQVLIDADGYRESFFAGPPPTAAEAAQIQDGIVRAWTRSTTRAERRAVGGAPALRAAMASDPLFLAEMRRRFLGPPDELPRGAVWRSDARGPRWIDRSEDGNELLLQRPDAGLDTFARDGRLLSVQVPGYPLVELEREGGRAVGVVVGSERRLHLDRDSWDRIEGMRRPDGSRVRFDYLGRVLHQVTSPAGVTRFGYDEQGRLTSIEGPDTWLAVRYDAQSGRVAEAQGPRGRVVLSDLGDSSELLEVTADLPTGRATCRWNPEARRRTVTGVGAHEVAFDRAGQPTDVVVDGEVLALAWDGARLAAAERGGRRVEFERDDGALSGVIDPDGRRTSVRTNTRGRVLSWTDPEGRTGALRGVDDYGGVEQSGIARYDRSRDPKGRLRAVEWLGGEALTAGWDYRGLLRDVSTVKAGTAGVRIDEAGRLNRYETPDGAVLTVRYGRSGPEGIAVDGAEVALSRDDAGRLSGWRGPMGGASVQRDGDGLAVGFADSLGRWTAQRNDGWLASFDDGVSLDVRGGARPTAWAGAGLGLELEWDGRDVVGWTSSWSGRVERSVDDAGRAEEITRGPGRWALDRDGTGRLRGLTVADGGRFDLPADASGRPSSAVHPGGLAWRFRWDPLGRLVGLRSTGPEWSLRFERSGRPYQLRGPDGREASLDWDRQGRWRTLHVPGQPGWAARYGRLGPTIVGDWRWDWLDGALAGFGPADSVAGWSYRRGLAGRVAGVDWRQPGQMGGAAGLREEREFDRDGAGRPTKVGPWSVRWSDGRPVAVGDAWAVDRDGAGRARGWTGAGGAAAVELDAWGDPIRLALGDAAWAVQRDSLGRPVRVDADGLRWDLARDPLGRVPEQVIDRGGRRFELTRTPLDGTTGLPSDTLAASLGIETPDRPDASKRDGSVALQVSTEDGRALAFDVLRDPAGGVEAVVGFWGSTGGVGDEAVDESVDPLLAGQGSFESSDADPIGAALDGPQPAGLRQPVDPIGDALGGDPTGDALGVDPIGAALDARPLRWGGALVQADGGEPLLPSPLGVGAALDAAGTWRLAADGGTVAWIGPGASFDGLRLPSPGGRWVTPSGFRAHPAPRGGVDPEPHPLASPPGPGLADGAARWWADLGLRADDLAHLPRGIAGDPRAWRRPRVDAFAEDAGLPPSEPDAGLGGALPPVPGADRLLPTARRAERVPFVELLALLGELPPRALQGDRWLDGPAGWSVELPGAATLRDLADRRARPTLPPQAPGPAVAGFAPALAGVLTGAGAAAAVPADRLVVAADGLPPGTPALRAGVDVLAGDGPTTPGGARASAFEGLGDDPLAPGATRRQVSREDAALLTWASLAPGEARPLSGLLEAVMPEAWRIEWPDGRSVVVDERGRLLSADLGARLIDAWARRTVAAVGAALLVPRGAATTSIESLALPATVPSSGGPVEARWGLAAEHPELPLDPYGGLASPALRDAPDRPPGAAAAPR